MLIARSVHPLPGEAERMERLLALVDLVSSRRVLVIGDLIADEFIYGEVSRVSREAPVLILKHRERTVLPGGGANAIYNLADLGANVLPVGVLGEDEPGEAAFCGWGNHGPAGGLAGWCADRGGYHAGRAV